MEAIDTKKLSDAQVDSKLSHYHRVINTLESKIRKHSDPDLQEKLKAIQIEWCYLKRESESRQRTRFARKEHFNKSAFNK